MLYSTGLLQICEECGENFKWILAEIYSVRSFEGSIGIRKDHHILYTKLYAAALPRITSTILKIL
jgi:hypothetical protein